MKLYIYLGMLLVVIAGGLYGYKLYTENEKFKVQLAAIKNPATKKVEVINRVITRVVEKPNQETVSETIHENISTGTDSTPHIPTEVNGRKSNFYVSGSYGVGWEPLSLDSWGVGAGVYLLEGVAVGIRYDTGAGVQSVKCELTVKF